MELRFVNNNTTIFDLDKCKLEIRGLRSQLHTKFIPIKYLNELYTYCDQCNQDLKLDLIDDNSIICISKRRD